jgi:hypothetical protein
MLEAPQTCKCLDQEDKKLMLKIIDEAIKDEERELKKIEQRRMFSIMKPPFVEPFQGIRSSLKRVHEEFKKSVEELKKNVETYPKCSSMSQFPIKPPTTEKDTSFKSPTYEYVQAPVPYSQRKLP